VEKYRFERTGSAAGRVHINDTQWFEGVPEDIWTFRIGAYQVCEKWLKERVGRNLEFDDIEHFKEIIGALAITADAMERIDDLIDTHGGWPVGSRTRRRDTVR
jgi:hypothetical protein